MTVGTRDSAARSSSSQAPTAEDIRESGLATEGSHESPVLDHFEKKTSGRNQSDSRMYNKS